MPAWRPHPFNYFIPNPSSLIPVWHFCCSSVSSSVSTADQPGGRSMNILGWLLFGLIVGAIAKLLMPGRDPGVCIVPILLGLAGSFAGGFLASTLLGRQ